jgi:hypothetical protein
MTHHGSRIGKSVNASDDVSIQVSDPWDVVTKLGDAPISGRLQCLAAGVAIVRLDSPLAFQGRTLDLVSATPRYATGVFMQASTAVAANLAFLDADGTPALSAIGTVSRL